METPLPSNDELESFSQAVNWKLIEQQRTSFNSMVATLAKDPDRNNTLPLDDLSECVGATVHTTSAPEDINSPNVLYLEKEGYPYILGSYVGTRYRTGK
ncbi:MAG: hypothetical protein AAGK74_16545, partial [Chloroflexota bacterium]